MSVKSTINKLKPGNLVGLLLVGIAVVGLGYFAYSRIPTKAGVHGTQNASQAALQGLAQQLHEDIDGITIENTVSLYQSAINLSDGDFIRLYNIYNELFQTEDGETLKVAVEGEFAWWGNYSFMVVRDAFLSRCAALNLS